MIDNLIAGFSAAAIALHLLLRFAAHAAPAVYDAPLLAALLGGIPLIVEILIRLSKREFGSDVLAGISIVAAALLGEYLTGTIVVLMLSGGHALENYAIHSASSALKALAKRIPSAAHRRLPDGKTEDIQLQDVAVGDTLVIHPHEICPVDGTVAEGHGVMDESYLTGEPFRIEKAPGSDVISGAVNGATALTIRAVRRAVDSRYAKIVEVIRASEKNRPRIRRIGDRIGAFYTPLSLAVAAAAWAFGGDATRFLAVLVVATPCPMIIAIPIAVIGSVSLAARRGIVVKKPSVLEEIDNCRTAIFDKTGTLTYGEPQLDECLPAPGFDKDRILVLTAALERYSKHPLASAIQEAARHSGGEIPEASEIRERPGQGLVGVVSGRRIRITGRKKILEEKPAGFENLPETSAGLECAVLVDGSYAALLRFRDTPRAEGRSFIGHLAPRHRFERAMIVSGDREQEVRYLALRVGIDEVHAEKTPEEKLEIVRGETKRAKTMYVGDGINDAPALLAATVGVAIGRNSDITSESAGAVVMDNSLTKVDELMHIGRRMRRIALQSAWGGMTLSAVAMGFAAAGLLPPLFGALSQEAIDILAIVNALRAAFPPRHLSDF